MKKFRFITIFCMLMIFSFSILIPIIDNRYRIIAWVSIVLYEILINIFAAIIFSIFIQLDILIETNNYRTLRTGPMSKILYYISVILFNSAYFMKNVSIIHSHSFITVIMNYVLLILLLFALLYIISNRLYISEEAIYIYNKNKRIEYKDIIKVISDNNKVTIISDDEEYELYLSEESLNEIKNCINKKL